MSTPNDNGRQSIYNSVSVLVHNLDNPKELNSGGPLSFGKSSETPISALTNKKERYEVLDHLHGRRLMVN